MLRPVRACVWPCAKASFHCLASIAGDSLIPWLMLTCNNAQSSSHRKSGQAMHSASSKGKEGRRRCESAQGQLDMAVEVTSVTANSE